MAHVIITHRNCSDGFAAAWVARQTYPDATIHEAQYGDDPPVVTACDNVLITDFSYDRVTLQILNNQVASLVCLDHHQTAAANLVGLPYCHFDMQRSGAGMAWDYLNPGIARPWLVNYVEDSDLWRYSLTGSRAVKSVIRSTPFTVRAYDALAARPVEDVIREGEAIRGFELALVNSAVRSAGRINLAGYTGIPCANSGNLQSEIGHALAVKAPFAVVWYARNDGHAQLSLRSADHGADVALVASQYGGGGHKHAAGCTLVMSEFLKLLVG